MCRIRSSLMAIAVDMLRVMRVHCCTRYTSRIWRLMLYVNNTARLLIGALLYACVWAEAKGVAKQAECVLGFVFCVVAVISLLCRQHQDASRPGTHANAQDGSVHIDRAGQCIWRLLLPVPSSLLSNLHLSLTCSARPAPTPPLDCLLLPFGCSVPSAACNAYALPAWLPNEFVCHCSLPQPPILCLSASHSPLCLHQIQHQYPQPHDVGV